jgi:Flp pilus assembly protein TadD
MRPKAGTEPDVFLSSPLRDFADVRAEIIALAPSRFWSIPAELAVESGTPGMAITQRMAQQIRTSNIFICVLTGRYGTSVFEDTQSVSILETEIYHAALFHDDPNFFLMEPFDADARLNGLLDVVRTMRPGVLTGLVRPKRDIMDEIRRILEASKPRKQRSRALSRRKLVSELTFRRGAAPRDIEFLDRVFRPVSDRADKDRIREQLSFLTSETRMEYRLSRTWIVLRELSAAPYDDEGYSEYLPLWNTALGAWSSAAAWLSLHGHLYAGRLAAVNSLLRIRESMNPRELAEDLPRYIQGTKGARGSEYYSMAKLMRTKAEREHYLRLARSDVEQGLAAQTDGDVSGYLAILGHIDVAQGRLTDATAIFSRMRELREERGDPGGIGEALKDEASVLIRQWRFTEAENRLHRAVELLEIAANHPFLVQALKALAVAQAANGHIPAARATLLHAYDVAVQHEIYAQISTLMELVHDPATVLGHLSALIGRR